MSKLIGTTKDTFTGDRLSLIEHDDGTQEMLRAKTWDEFIQGLRDHGLRIGEANLPDGKSHHSRGRQ